MTALLRVALFLWAAQSPAHALLDVPFMPQPPALCGGAAVSMVLRYWGHQDVFPQDFAPLVSQSDGGIFTGALVSAVRERGWTAVVLPGDNGRARLRAEIDQGRPVIALIQVAPGVFHYVVIAGSTDADVVFHDPARAPFRVLDWAAFDRAWAASGRWMMLVLPPANATARAVPAPEAGRDRTPCSALVDHAVDTALAGQMEEAEAELVAATRLCPSDPAAWRELAGLRFSQRRWPDANRWATVAARLAPADAYAWQLAASSRYLLGDTAGALDAWNHIGEPRVDAIAILGAARTPQPVISRIVGLEPRAVLTSSDFTRASRRLQDLPAAADGRLKYEPLGDGRARIDVMVDERPLVPSGWPALVRLGVQTAVRNELRLELSGALGAGELVAASWRWSANRPRVAVALAIPSPWFSGVATVETAWERQSYGSIVRERRRRSGVQFADWSTSWLKWTGGAAIDHFDDHGFAAIDAALHARLARDRVAVTVSSSGWIPLSSGRRLSTVAVAAAWRSTPETDRRGWSSSMEFRRASAAAPLALWSGAGTGQGRPALLRAHPLLDDGVVTGAAFGRELVNGTLEYSQPVGRAFGAVLAVAGFVDAARASHRSTGLGRSPLFADAGIGLRVRLPGGAGVLRADLAHGLHGGATTLSAGWVARWPK
ncbi:MAG: hypothetical protein EPO35_04775 [Acidobacteria bacterium]|nr:MAG: hypothetical protein EPO35_04775 [Acidobacteriota bacterium]